MRLFAALVPPDDAVEHLEEFLEPRRAAGTFRWSAAEQWHVTLAFTADLPERSLDELDDLLTSAVARHERFGMRITGGGAFPHPDGARVLYAALDLDDGAPLDRLAAAVARAGAPDTAAAVSPFTNPVTVYPNVGLAAPYTRDALLAVTVSGAGVTVREPGA